MSQDIEDTPTLTRVGVFGGEPSSQPAFPVREYGSQLSGLIQKKFASFILLA
jgi:hypothetical protein